MKETIYVFETVAPEILEKGLPKAGPVPEERIKAMDQQNTFMKEAVSFWKDQHKERKRA